VRSLAVLIGGVLISAGCAALTKQSTGEPSSLPPLKSTANTVGLEIALLKLTPETESQIAPIWSEIDESQLPIDLRRELADNGMRCGLFGSRIPAKLKLLIDQLVEPQLIDSEADSTGDGIRVGAGPVPICRHLQSRTGQRHELLASEVLPEIAVLRSEHEQVVGKTYQDAQCIWALKTFPQGDGRVRVQLTPEVHFGQPQNQWIGQSTGIFRQVTARRRKAFEDLRIEAVVSPGQTIMLSGTGTVKGLGQHFFTYGTDTETPGKKLLLIRLARSQYDDLFSSERILTPILSATE
jgi:hypothetical protein